MRFERATVYEGTQWGVESTPGTVVAAHKRLQGLSFELENMTDIKPYRPQGNKFNTASQRGKEMTSGKIDGILCFNDMCYVASSWLTSTSPAVPANNSKWNVSATTTNTVGFTFKGSVLAPAAYTTAALFQAAIGAMASVGPDNVRVTGTPGTGWTIEFIGGLSTDTSAITAVTGTASATIALDTAGTLTNRWTFIMSPSGPDDVITFTVEKGVQGVSNQAQRAAFAFVEGLSTKFTKNEASFTGDMAAQTTTDPVTMTTSPVDVACIPVDPAETTVWMGTSLTNLALMDRILELEFGVTGRANGLMTLNRYDPSFSNRIEGAPELTSKFFIEHDVNGQAMLAHLRADEKMYTVVENLGPVIESGFRYRMKWTYYQELLKPNTGDVDNTYGRNYDSTLVYSSVLGTALKLEIDTVLSGL